jgi:hypothetical protein
MGPMSPSSRDSLGFAEYQMETWEDEEVHRMIP